MTGLGDCVGKVEVVGAEVGMAGAASFVARTRWASDSHATKVKVSAKHNPINRHDKLLGKVTANTLVTDL